MYAALFGVQRRVLSVKVGHTQAQGVVKLSGKMFLFFVETELS